MGNLKFRSGGGEAAGELSAALFDLRDSLIELSLALKDLQFDADLEQRKIAEDTTRELLAQIASVHGLDPS